MSLIKQIISISLLCLCCHISGYATESESDKTLNQTMSEIGQLMTELFPLISSVQPLTDVENKKIFQNVKRLQKLFAEAGPSIQKKSATYQMSYQLLQDYLDSIAAVENPAFFPQLKQKLLTLSDFCVSCHTQDNKFRTLFNEKNTPKLDTLLAHAEFNFTTRNYHDAAEYYEKHLFMTSNLSNSDVLMALHRLLTIYVQVLNKPNDAKQLFIKLKALPKMTAKTSEYIAEIIEALEKLQQSEFSGEGQVSFADINKYASQYLGSANAHEPFISASPLEEVQRLWLRGLLFRYLNNVPTEDEMPKILYWLAVCDRSIGFGYDYTLADFYLKQCITRYSTHPMARQCFADYKAYVTFYFTSPTEPVIPIEVHKQLKELESYLTKNRRN